MILYNYTSLQKRDTKIYNVGGYNIAGGMSVEFLKVVGPVTILGIILGVIVANIFGLNYFNPIAENFNFTFTLIWTGISVGAGCALWYIPIAGYRLYQYLGAYFKPKKVYMNDFRHTQFILSNIKIRAFIKNLL